MTTVERTSSGMSEEVRVSRDNWELILNIFENELFSVIERYGVDLEFQVSVLGKIGPLVEIRNSRIGSRLREWFEKSNFYLLSLNICEM